MSSGTITFLDIMNELLNSIITIGLNIKTNVIFFLTGILKLKVTPKLIQRGKKKSKMRMVIMMSKVFFLYNFSMYVIQ